MSLLLKVKEWVTVSDAAKYLSRPQGVEITDADIFESALSEKLVLSVLFSGHRDKLYGVRCKLSPRDLAVTGEGETGSIEIKSVRNEYQLESFLDIERELEGVFDLPMYGGEYSSVLEKYKSLLNKDRFSPSRGVTPSIVKDGKYFYELYSKSEMLDPYTSAEAARTSLPKDCLYVIRTSELERFEETLFGCEALQSKNTGHINNDNPKSIQSLLKIIITMAVSTNYRYGSDDHKRHVSSKIASQAEKLDIIITDETVHKWLEEARSLLGQEVLERLKKA